MRGVTHKLGYGILVVKKGGIWEIWGKKKVGYGRLEVEIWVIRGKKRWDIGDWG